MTTNNLPTLGDLVCDRVTGFQGIVTTHAKHLTGCDRLWVEPKIGEDGKRRDGCWVDIDMLDIVTAGAVQRVVYTRAAPGGADLPRSY